jgi:hypothetical protein
MSELRELYQTTILDHNKQPRNFRVPEGANREAVGHNPLCGDRVVVHVRLDGDEVADVGFQGNGCAISTASASLMTQIFSPLVMSAEKGGITTSPSHDLAMPLMVSVCLPLGARVSAAASSASARRTCAGPRVGRACPGRRPSPSPGPS